MKFIIPVLTVTVFTVFLIANKPNFHRASPPLAATDTIPEDSILSFTISAVGDLMCHSTQFNYARVDKDSFNFIPCFEYVQKYLQASDFLIGNLETTLRGTEIAYSGYPYFNSPDDFVTAIKKVGFDFVVTANNHANDTGEKGILRTISVLDQNGLPHTGTYRSQADRDSIRIVSVDGVKVGIIAYSYSTNGLMLTEGKPWLVNYCDSVLIQKDIAQSRKAGAELVIVFYHFGNEYERMPSEYQKNFVNYAVDCGADIVLGSHPHVLQPATFFKTTHATLDTGFIAYSLGNFISNQSDEYTDEGIIMNIHLSKNKNTKHVRIDRVDYIPTWVYRGKNEAKKLHVVLPAMMINDTTSVLPDFITAPYQIEMKSAQEHTKDIMSRLNKNILPANPY